MVKISYVTAILYGLFADTGTEILTFYGFVYR